MINWQIVKNPGNWLVIGSMVLIGMTMFHLVQTHTRAERDNTE